MSGSRQRRSQPDPHFRGPLKLPDSPELERAVLGGLQHAPDVGTALSRLEADDFVSECHRTILRAIEALAAQGRRADLPQLIDTLEQAGDLVDVGGRAYVAKLDLDLIPSNLDGYIDRLKELRALREAAVSAERFLGALGDSVPARIPDALAALEAQFRATPRLPPPQPSATGSGAWPKSSRNRWNSSGSPTCLWGSSRFSRATRARARATSRRRSQLAGRAAAISRARHSSSPGAP